MSQATACRRGTQRSPAKRRTQRWGLKFMAFFRLPSLAPSSSFAFAFPFSEVWFLSLCSSSISLFQRNGPSTTPFFFTRFTRSSLHPLPSFSDPSHSLSLYQLCPLHFLPFLSSSSSLILTPHPSFSLPFPLFLSLSFLLFLTPHPQSTPDFQTRRLRSIEELCGVSYHKAVVRLHKVLQHFTRSSTLLTLEEEESR